MKHVKGVLSSTSLRLALSLFTLGVLVGRDGDTSESLAMKHLAFRVEEFSLGDSKRDEDDGDAIAIAATWLDVSSSSSSSSSDEYSS
jgi:hypothetical protein